MSSLAYLLATDEPEATGEPDVLRDGAEQLADAVYCLPLLWVALLPAGATRLVDADNVIFTVERAEGLELLQRRAARITALLPEAHAGGYVERFAEVLAEESASHLVIDATEIAEMDEPGKLVQEVDTITRWLDGDDSADGPGAVKRQCGLTARTALPEPVDGLDAEATAEQWQRVIAMVGSGDCWW